MQDGVTLGVGDTFLRQSGGYNHLYIVTHIGVYTEFGYPSIAHALNFNITSCKGRRGEDLSCVLQPHEHPFVTQQSYINYRQPYIAPVPEVLSFYGMSMKQPCSVDVMQKIIDGAMVSSLISQEIKKILNI